MKNLIIMSRDILEELRLLLAHRAPDAGSYESFLEKMIEAAADEIEKLRQQCGQVT